ncbi:gluconokinase [Rhizosphaericola mali]|uniref:Gluconokinase n=2 Tax=Rhizosphaericola mali TaxID=2545455 RepID=A0A5P2GCU3_9BACT|nr:gluconokinase [Rhizosphaericola mali]
MENKCYIIMGVSSSGKTTMGKYAAKILGCDFIDGDDLHPEANIEKMSAGIPLTDGDREPWFVIIGKEANDYLTKNKSIVIACSALKLKYREILRREISSIHFIYLKGSYGAILAQMQARKGHFMPESLLQSQFDILEEPTDQESDVTILPIGKGEKERLDNLFKLP